MAELNKDYIALVVCDLELYMLRKMEKQLVAANTKEALKLLREAHAHIVQEGPNA